MSIHITPPQQDGSFVASHFVYSFRNYSAGYSQAERPWWTYIFSYFIVLSPAIGILSAFALIAIPLAHNTESYFYGIGNKNISKREDYLVKLLVVVVPLALSTFVYLIRLMMGIYSPNLCSTVKFDPNPRLLSRVFSLLVAGASISNSSTSLPNS